MYNIHSSLLIIAPNSVPFGPLMSTSDNLKKYLMQSEGPLLFVQSMKFNTLCFLVMLPSTYLADIIKKIGRQRELGMDSYEALRDNCTNPKTC